MKIKKKVSVTLLLALLSHQIALAQFPVELELSDLNGQNGIGINGEKFGDFSGSSVSSAGDFNDDGIDDLIIGAYNSGAGKSYVIFGSSTGLNLFNLGSLNGKNGFVINGESYGDDSGLSVSSAGDFNGDEIDDLIIGAPDAFLNGGRSVGKSYVVFGRSEGLPNSLNLSELNGENGFVINGENERDFLGRSVSSAGDFNGDEIDDLIIGAFGADPDGETNAGKSYVVFGSTADLPRTLNLSTLNGENGFVINGENAGDHLGYSVSSAGDFNGDEVDDLILGAYGADPDGQSFAGKSYVVFGSDDENGLPNSFNLSSLNGENGFAIHGQNQDDFSGQSVSLAGDVNGDGLDDLIIGAFNSGAGAGKSYVVFGNTEGLSNPLNLSTLNGETGFVINGENENDGSGYSVSSAGDVNGDGVDDLIIGADLADSDDAINAGKSYVVFGSTEGFPNPFNLSDLDGLNGFVINGENRGDLSGHSVSSVGDVNGDEVDDLIIGAYFACDRSGRSYVVYGQNNDGSNNGDIIFKNGFGCM